MTVPRPAGLGYSIELPTFDFETYSEAGFYWDESKHKYTAPPPVTSGKKKGLKVVGLGVYARHPSTEIISLAFDLKDGRGCRLWMPGPASPTELFDYLAAGGLIEAHNAAFEFDIWEFVGRRLYGWPAIDPKQIRCSAAKSRAWSLPGALDEAGDVLDLRIKKDPEGDRLIKLFTMPRTPTKKDPRRRILPTDAPDEAMRFYRYNAQDVAAESELSRHVPDLDGINLDFWLADQRINFRGVHIDKPMVDAASKIVLEAHERYNAELQTVTHGAVDKASELAKLVAWLHGRGVHTETADEDALDELLDNGALPDDCRRAIEIRQAIGSAAVKKLFALSDQLAPDGRVHDLFIYHGARTGRPTGAGAQPTNFPKAGPHVHKCSTCSAHFGGRMLNCPWCGALRAPGKAREWSPEAADDAYKIIKTGSLDALEYFFGDAMLTIAGCLRGMFTAAPGFDLIASDYSAIEAVVLACLAGEQWRIDVFRTHGQIYLESASRAFGVSVEEMQAQHKATGQHHPLRDKGKRMELGLGFGGWITALRSRQIQMQGTDEELVDAVLRWRDASPAVVEFWGGQIRKPKRGSGGRWIYENFGIEGAAVDALKCRETWFYFRGIGFKMHGDALYCRLLSGRYLTYHSPRLEASERQAGTYQISYETWNTDPKKGPYGWVTMRTYGGRLTENIVQATAHDLQRCAILAHEAAGYPIVLHVYDENVSEVPTGTGNLAHFEALMMQRPEWAADWPIKAAGGWIGKRYRKG